MTTKSLLSKIESSKVYDVAVKTSLDRLPFLSENVGNHVYLKREDQQPVFSFKIRGAYQKISSLSDEEKKRGLIASSAGNHAQGVAYTAKQLGVKATIVMPKTTPPIKVEAVHRFGGKVVLHGDSYDDAYAHAKALETEKGFVFIHPYDDIEVIAGQGTVAQELLNQLDTIDMVFIPVGGGGLLAGMLSYIKAKRPEIKVIAVEPNDAGCLHAALAKKRRVTLDTVGIFADGVAVRQVGKLPYKLVKDYVDDVVLVSTDDICAAIKDIFDNTRSISEPAGALSLAGLKKVVREQGLENKHLVAINSGANINFDRLRHVAERAEVGKHKEALFAVKIPEKPGSFKAFCQLLGKRSITEFNYRYNDPHNAVVFCGVALKEGLKEKQEILTTLHTHGYYVEDLTMNELAILHIRHMVGGPAPYAENEIVYRVQFPERPGALLAFLKELGSRWNISLFHYRNHGADFGRVFVGIQVPKQETKAFQAFKDKIGYNFIPETQNTAYSLFL